MSQQYCAVCRLGVLQAKKATYTTWLEDRLVMLPGTPIWTCDLCGEVLFDIEIAVLIDALLGSDRRSARGEGQSDTSQNIHLHVRALSGRRWSA